MPWSELIPDLQLEIAINMSFADIANLVQVDRASRFLLRAHRKYVIHAISYRELPPYFASLVWHGESLEDGPRFLFLCLDPLGGGPLQHYAKLKRAQAAIDEVAPYYQRAMRDFQVPPAQLTDAFLVLRQLASLALEGRISQLAVLLNYALDHPVAKVFYAVLLSLVSPSSLVVSLRDMSVFVSEDDPAWVPEQGSFLDRGTTEWRNGLFAWGATRVQILLVCHTVAQNLAGSRGFPLIQTPPESRISFSL